MATRLKPGQRQRMVEIREHWVREQIKWIGDHGGNLVGYVERYGCTRGKSIYEADTAALIELQAMVRKAKGLKP
jgi:hypothetical protein